MTDNLSTVTDHLAGDVPGPDTPAAATPPSTAEEMNSSVVNSVQALEQPAPPAGVGEVTEAPSLTEDSGPADADAGADNDVDADAGVDADVGATGNRASRRAPSHEQLVAEGDAAGDYLERLLDILDFDGDIDLDVEGERAVVSIIGDSADIAKMVGDRGEVLDALQELTRLAATAETGQRSRLMLDVAGYRAQRRTELSELGTRTAQGALDSGEPVRLAPMNPFERKIVHDAVAAVSGVSSSSEGEEPRRRVVVSPDA